MAGDKESGVVLLRRANQFVLAWFVATLVFSYSVPQFQKSRFAKASYVACDNPRSISRVSRGKSLLYVKVNDNRLGRLREGADEKYVCLLLSQIAD